MLIEEEWLPVPDYEGCYEVSNCGRVRSVDRTVTRSDGVVQKRRGKILASSPNTAGHLQVNLTKDGRGASTRVHRLVLLAFVGPCPEGMQACHWDDDKYNNHLSNLRWASGSDNLHDRVRNGRHHQARKKACHLGHAFTPENTYIKPNGARACRTCLRRRDKELYDRSPARRSRRNHACSAL